MRAIQILGCLALALAVGCDDTSSPVPSIPQEIDSLVATTDLPLKQEPDVRWTGYPPDVAVFLLDYGNPEDCPNGCIYSTGYGLLNKGKVGWFQFEDLEQRDLSHISLYALDEEDGNLYSTQAFQAMESADGWFFRYSFLHRVAATPSVGTNALILVARTLETYIDDPLARAMIENPAVRADQEVLFVLAAIPAFNSVYAEVREEARELLGLDGP